MMVPDLVNNFKKSQTLQGRGREKQGIPDRINVCTYMCFFEILLSKQATTHGLCYMHVYSCYSSGYKCMDSKGYRAHRNERDWCENNGDNFSSDVGNGKKSYKEDNKNHQFDCILLVSRAIHSS